MYIYDNPAIVSCFAYAGTFRQLFIFPCDQLNLKYWIIDVN